MTATLITQAVELINILGTPENKRASQVAQIIMGVNDGGC
jgi:hypothetical protein